MLKKFVGSLILLAATAPLAHAQVNAYSNITTSSGFSFANGGAAVQSGDTITRLVADDITVGSGFGGRAVTQFTFSVANLNATAVTASPLVRFYATNGTGGLPGTLLTAINFNPIAFGAGAVNLFTFTGNTGLVIPTNGNFWAGITFDNNTGATGATAAQLNNLGQGLYNPSTVGSSQDLFFQSTAAGSFVSNNPPGSLLFFGGNPRANFGWQFQVAAVPEPSAGVFLSVGVLSLAVLTFGARRRLA